jgi:hypothetical protein
MGAQLTTARKIHEIQLTPALDTLLRKVEGLAKKPLVEDRLDGADVGPVVGFFDDTGTPHIAVSSGAQPTIADIAVELARLDFRRGRFEKNMPYYEMRHEANRRLCRRLYRIMEQEIVLVEAESAGVPARRTIVERLVARLLEPLVAGSYRRGEVEPGRLREGALDGLELTMAESDAVAARHRLVQIAEHDPAIARPLGLMYKVVENHRPFEAGDRVRAAYYLAVPFLFDARKPAQAPPGGR